MSGWWFVDAALLGLTGGLVIAAYRRGLAWALTAATISTFCIAANAYLCLLAGRIAARAGWISERSAAYETLAILSLIPFSMALAFVLTHKTTATPRRRHPHNRRGVRRPPGPAWPSRWAAALATPAALAAVLVVTTTITSYTLQGSLAASPVKSHILNSSYRAATPPIRNLVRSVLVPAPVAAPPAPVIATRPAHARNGPAPTIQSNVLDTIVQQRASVVKITGRATGCKSFLSASGFVIAPQRVLTNAHAIVRVPHIRVQQGGIGPRYKAHVLHFDPAADIAVLHVPHLAATPIPLATTPSGSSTAAIVGYPLGGDFTVSPAKQRTDQNMWAKNISTQREQLRAAMVLDANIRPGNSGGPVLNHLGHVTGIVFARDRNNEHTGFANPVRSWKHLATKPLTKTSQNLSAPCPAPRTNPETQVRTP